jgi:eukaryotic-like serine/threonine-protein kinase
MRGCAGRELLERFLDGTLSAAAGLDLAVHVEGCAACQHLLDQMTNDAPGSLRAYSVVKSEDSEDEPSPEFLERVYASLSETNPPRDVLPGQSRGDWASCDDTERIVVRDCTTRPPAVVPGYEILGELGRGGMGVVYKARQVGLNRLVALKMILAADRARAVNRARFRTEAEAVARLQHPNIVQIYAIGECDGSPYFSMELVVGPTLAQICQGRPQPCRTAAKLVGVLTGAIHCAHREGILHRDLKPANVLLQPVVAGVGLPSNQTSDVQRRECTSLSTSVWTAKIADFGLAKRTGDVSMTQHGLILGTPSYMAPEQITGKERVLGPTVDLYALGAILYELLTGRAPFVGSSIESTVAIVINDDPIPPRRLQPDVPRDLETICLKCLEKEPSRRYPTAAELALDLARFENGEPIQARAPSTVDRWVKLARRHLVVVAGVAGVIAALALGFATTGVTAMREARARRLADTNARQATASARLAEAAQSSALRQTYQARLAAAIAAMGNHDIREAARQLDLAPAQLRGWEWRHLHAQLDQSLTAVTVPHHPGDSPWQARVHVATAMTRDGARVAFQTA